MFQCVKLVLYFYQAGELWSELGLDPVSKMNPKVLLPQSGSQSGLSSLLKVKTRLDVVGVGFKCLMIESGPPPLSG